MNDLSKKYEYTVDGFGEFVRNELLGKPEAVPGVDPEQCGQKLPVLGSVEQIEERLIDSGTAISFSKSLGDDNPLYTDPVYARKTRYGGLIATPVITNLIRYLPPHPKAFGPFPVSSLVGGLGWMWNDVIRVGDRLRTSFYLKDIVEKKGRSGRLFITKSDAKYWNQYKELAATGWGTQIMIGTDVTEEEIKKGKGFRDALIYDRSTHHYSKEEIEQIERDINNEYRRGAEPFYWEDVHVGDQLTPVVKGPLTVGDMMKYFAIIIAGGFGTFEIAYRQEKAAPRTATENPLTGWPYESGWMEHYDFNLCKARGMPGPFDEGQIRACFAAHLLSNWMGDNGFIRKVDVQFRKPNYYGDTQWVKGEVVKKYKDKVSDEEYNAVEIRILTVNQIGESTAPGIATVYLPSPDNPVKLPIPHEDKFEDYENYVADCKKRRAVMIEEGFL
jgi:acyl dehydratase